MGDEGASAANFASKLKGLDSSGVEVDEEQVAPTIAANSPEEDAELAKMEELLIAAGDEAAIAADKSIKLLCLRGRKYDVERAAALLPKHLAYKEEFGVGKYSEQVVADLKTNKVVSLRSKDADGRAVIWLRMRYHDPKVSKAEDMARLISVVMLHALEDPEVQRFGVVVVQDMTGLKLKNLDPSAAKVLFGKVFPNLPIRVGRVCIFNPPWFIGHVILPIVFTFLSKKLKGRIALVNGSKPEKLTPYVPSTSLPAELEGTHAFDGEKWADERIAALAK